MFIIGGATTSLYIHIYARSFGGNSLNSFYSGRDLAIMLLMMP